MPLRRRAFALSIEREVEAPEGGRERIRWSVELEPTGTDGPEPGPDEIREALARLRGELESALGASGRSAPTPTRTLEELVDAYRPRQGELVELLRAEGEITEGEADILRGYIARAEGGGPVPPAIAVSVAPALDRPLAALPLENDRAPTTPRPTARLLDLYRIENLKQAGAVRARRQISYEEYMGIKRYFAAAEAGAAATARAPSDPVPLPPDAPPP